MKKQDISGIVVYLLIVVFGLIYCFTVLRSYSTSQYCGITDSLVYWLWIIGSIFAGIIFNAVLFELAHRAGAKTGRYIIISTNILGLCFFKDEQGKNKVRYKSFDGLTGETKIRPDPNAEKEPNPRPYLLFGSMFYAIEIIVIVTVFVLLTSLHNSIASDTAYFLLTMGVAGGAMLIYNIIPMRLDSITDGYRLTMVSNSKNKTAFNELLRVEYEISQGNTDVEIMTFDNITNFTADLNLNKVYVLLDKRDYVEAEKLIDLILTGKDEVSNSTYLRARSQKIFINLITRPLDEAAAFYNELDIKEIREISHDVSMPSIRTYILISGLIEKSESETLIALKNVEKAYKKTPDRRKHVERTLYNEALQKVIDTHPNWKDLNSYILPDELEEEIEEPKK